MLRLENWKWMEQHLFKSSYTPEHFDISWHLSLSGRSGLLYKTFFYHKYIQLQCLESSISFLVVTAKRPSTETYSDNLNQFKNTETSLIHKINFMWNSFTWRTTTPQIILCKFCTFSRIVVYYKFCKFSPSMQMVANVNIYHLLYANQIRTIACYYRRQAILSHWWACQHGFWSGLKTC